MKLLIACSLIFSMHTLALAGPKKTSSLEFTQIEQSKNVSQLLRSNAPHNWAYNSDRRALNDLAKYIDAEGTISGDLHLGNMTVIPVQTLSGQQEMKFLNVDFDDGGHGPFALEIARFITVAKASSKDIKVNFLLESYLEGLQGREVPKPNAIRRAEEVTVQEYELARVSYVAKKMSSGGFKYEDGEIERWNGSPNVADVAPLFEGMSVIEVAKRPQERGGSVGEKPRLWVLTQDKAGSFHIYELKPYLDTALSQYSVQADPESRIKELHEIYWPGLNPKAYDLAVIGGERYWVREKKVEVLSYENRAHEDAARMYIANVIGLTQSRQAQGAQLLNEIMRNPARFNAAIEQYSNGYLEIANAVMK